MVDVPALTAAVLAVGGGLLLVSSLTSRVGHRLGVPVSLVFLVIGMLAGSDGPGGIPFDRFDVAYAVGTAALTIILFSGGLNTDLSHVRSAAPAATVLATVGVIGIAGVTALGGHALGLNWEEALLVGAIVSSTDAAAVFSVLGGVPLRRRVGLTLELESGLNDPVAVILTTAATLHMAGRAESPLSIATDIIVELGIGAVAGVGIGVIARELLRRVRLSTAALLPTVTIGVALIAFGVTSQIGGSGFLAVYVAGMVIGRAALPHRLSLQRFHDALAWLAQVGMFLLLGLLVVPSELPAVADDGLALALFLAFVARPLVVTLCLLPFGYHWREIVCIAWLGLRGAVPIILATLPVLTVTHPGMPDRALLDQFDLVFFIVVVGSLIPGTTVRWLPRLLRLEEQVPPKPSASIDITASVPVHGNQLSVYIAPDSPVVGQTLSDLPLPDDAVVMLIVRGNRLVAPRGGTQLAAGDHAFVLCPPERAATVTAVFAGSNA